MVEFHWLEYIWQMYSDISMDSEQTVLLTSRQTKKEISESWDMLKKLPLPPEIIWLIASYDRALSVKKLQKTDRRYTMLRTIQPFHYSYVLFSDYCHSYSYLHFKNSSKMYVYCITENNRLHKILYMYSSHRFEQNDDVLKHCYVRL